MLDGRHVLLVEDEYMLAQDLRRELEEVGAVVLGPEPSVSRALARVEDGDRIDAAILDVNLGGEQVFPVAQALVLRRVPFAFTTGYHEEVVSHYPAAIVCGKPVDTRHLFRGLRSLIDAAQS